MRLFSGAATGPALAAAALAAGCGSSAIASSPPAQVSVRVPPAPSVTAKVLVSFRPSARLARGGYYYAVVVLTRYAGYSAAAPPPCATSSDMRRTPYAFPHGGRRVQLVLVAGQSARGGWCPGGTYGGAVYAVPHRPSCGGYATCYGSSAESGPCWQLGERTVCGVVVPPGPKPEPPKPEPPKPPTETTYYSYPGGLPKPLDRRSRIVGRFTLRFPGGATG